MSAKRIVGAALAALVLSMLALPAAADIFLSARFALGLGEEANSYSFTAQVPVRVPTDGSLEWPQGCTQIDRSVQPRGQVMLHVYEIECAAALPREAVIRTPWLVDGASFSTAVMGVPVSRTFAGTDRGIIIPVGETVQAPRPALEVMREYLVQGAVHIWEGWDHLAFVLCLCLLVRGRQLLILITSFTLGHSISLALAFYEVVAVPIPPMEAVIALSIVIMARESLVSAPPQKGMERPLGKPLLVVSLFGLLHGLGFANALSELGVAPGERMVGLIFFNVGVEFGQLVFVGAIALVMAGLAQLSLARFARTGLLYGAGLMGAFWMVERIAGFPWSRAFAG